MSRLFALCLTLLALLAGCGPMYETQYSFTPPSSPEGRMCVSQCQNSRTMCRQSCSMEQQACRNEARSRAMIEYQAYANKQIANKQPVKKSPSDFEYYSSCGTSSCESRCEADYRSCFADVCGGRITSRQVCTAFCDQAPAAAPARPAASGGVALSPTPPQQNYAQQSYAPQAAPDQSLLCRQGLRVEVLSEGEWYPAVVKGSLRSDGRCPIHYEDYGSEDDEQVSLNRIRPIR